MSDNTTNDEQAPYGHCSGCVSPHDGATHQVGTIEHPNSLGFFPSTPKWTRHLKTMPYTPTDASPEKQKQRQLIIQTMRDDEADGLYDEQPKRKPMLSKDRIYEMAQLASVKCQPDANPAFMHALGAIEAGDFYENLINTGVLMVAKTAGPMYMEGERRCWNCGHIAEDNDGDPYRHCPGCGVKVVNP